jgi:hypothetical protein
LEAVAKYQHRAALPTTRAISVTTNPAGERDPEAATAVPIHEHLRDVAWTRLQTGHSLLPEWFLDAVPEGLLVVTPFDDDGSADTAVAGVVHLIRTHRPHRLVSVHDTFCGNGPGRPSEDPNAWEALVVMEGTAKGLTAYVRNYGRNADGSLYIISDDVIFSSFDSQSQGRFSSVWAALCEVNGWEPVTLATKLNVDAPQYLIVSECAAKIKTKAALDEAVARIGEGAWWQVIVDNDGSRVVSRVAIELDGEPDESNRMSTAYVAEDLDDAEILDILVAHGALKIDITANGMMYRLTKPG